MIRRERVEREELDSTQLGCWPSRCSQHCCLSCLMAVVTELTFLAASYHLGSWGVKLDHGPLEQEVTLEGYLHQPLLITLRENESQGKGRVCPGHTAELSRCPCPMKVDAVLDGGMSVPPPLV